MTIKTGIEKIKQKFNEDPLLVIFIGTLAVGATAKLIDAASAAHSRNAYAKQINYRVKNEL